MMDATETQRKSVLDIIGEMTAEGMHCRKNFVCYKSGFEILCKVKGIGTFDEIRCDSADAKCCGLSFEVLSRRYCQCPLRRYIAEHFHR